MITNFWEQFILHCNKNLKKEDTELLSILSEKYNILDYNIYVLHESIDSIISRIIIDTLPYKYAKGFIYKDTVYHVIFVEDGVIYALSSTSPALENITEKVNEMNEFVLHKRKQNER